MPEKNVFVASKEQLLLAQVLVHYDPNLYLDVVCDVSAYGVGAIFSDRMPVGIERAIRFVS